MTKNNIGKWNNLNGVYNINTADVVIFIEGIPQNFNLNLLNNKKFICFPREPLIHKNWEQFKFPTGYTYDNFFHVVTNPQFIDKNYDFLSNLEYNEHKKKFSAIISNKINSSGYKLRRNFLINLSKTYPNLCDIYGAGWTNELGSSYKGKLEGYHKNALGKNTKFIGLIDYKYSLCIENCSKRELFFREIYRCNIMLDYTKFIMVVYIFQINFPDDSYYIVDITSNNCLEKIKEIINKPITDKNITALKEARNLILNKYNIWSVIEKELNFMIYV